MVESMKKIVRTSRQMLHEIGREPTPEELAENLGMPLEKVGKELKIAKEPISLETPIGDEEDSHLGDFIEDRNTILPIDAAIQWKLRETTTRMLALLTPREESVLRMRFGIGMNTDHTLDEPAILGDPRTHPPDRGEGAEEAQAAEPVEDFKNLSGQLMTKDPDNPLPAHRRVMSSHPAVVRPFRISDKLRWRRPAGPQRDTKWGTTLPRERRRFVVVDPFHLSVADPSA
jgi:hypothetical protein